MADAIYYTKQQHQQNQANPSKMYSHFLYKALIVTIFLVILPLFPSQAPEFINHTLNTRGWEFLHLLFVGIAVSYGLFSRRNDETEKENNNNSSSNNNNNHSRFDNAHSYLSRFLQVSSVFDDEADSSPRAADVNKVQTWSNQYYRNEPVVVVAEEQPVIDGERRGTSSRISERPLLLPVRSLRSRVVDADAKQSIKEDNSVSRAGSNSCSKRISSDFSSKSKDFERLDHEELEGKLKDNVVLPSPIPWRSRSGRMEMKEMKAEEEDDSPSLFTLPSSMEEAEFNRSSKAKVSRSTRPNSTNSSSKLSSPSPSFSYGAQAKTAEEFVRKKSIYRFPPTPPPPPPPPPLSSVIRRSSSLLTPRSSDIDDGEFVTKDFKRSFTIESKDLNPIGNVAVPKSARTFRSNDPLAAAWTEKGFDDGGFDQLSFKTDRLNRDNITSMPQPTFRVFPEEGKEELVEKLVAECDEGSETEDEDDDEIAEISAFLGAATSTKNEQANSGSANEGGPDVDKKADEFIAKFREQIRLQRIESIKRSSAQISKKCPR